MWLLNFLVLLLLFFFASLLLVDFLKFKNTPNFPPGPFALPFVGSIFSVDMKQSHHYFTKLAQHYGDVFSIRLGRTKIVFVCGYKMVKEATLTQADNFVDRPYTAVGNRLYSGDKEGLLMSSGEIRKRQRRFAISTLRTFGLGQNVLEQSILEEARHLLEEIEMEKGKPFNPANLFYNAASNITCQLMMAKRFDYSDHAFRTIQMKLTELVYLKGSVWGLMYDSFPAVMKVLPGPHNKIFKLFKTLSGFIREEVECHLKDIDPDNPRDYIDAFLIEMEKHKHEQLGFTFTNILMCAMDLLMAGTETTATTMLWALVYLIKYPDVQKRVQEEIGRVIGPHRQPTMADRPNLPYTDAVIHESQRFGNIVPLNGLRMAAKDTTLGGYFIPKGTALMPMLTSVLFDKTQWETPNSFNPGHFLNAEGKFVKREAFLPFSAGKRMCLGEGLAKMELFLFLVSLFQKFSFGVEDRDKLSEEGITGTVRTPHPFKVHAKAH